MLQSSGNVENNTHKEYMSGGWWKPMEMLYKPLQWWNQIYV